MEGLSLNCCLSAGALAGEAAAVGKPDEPPREAVADADQRVASRSVAHSAESFAAPFAAHAVARVSASAAAAAQRVAAHRAAFAHGAQLQRLLKDSQRESDPAELSARVRVEAMGLESSA